MIQNKKGMVVKMKIIGLTGGIGSGKSTAAAYLELKGATIIDADQISREVMKKDEPAYKRIVETFGEHFLHDDGEIDRRALAGLVFSDQGKLKELNDITHFYISESIKEIIENEKELDTAMVVLDVPLPVREGFLELADEVWLVETSEEARIKRLMDFREYTYEEATLRMSNQPSNEAYREAADVILDNNGEESELIIQINEQLEKNG